jgi:F0F1-type ATP synthase assembly protein I
MKKKYLLFNNPVTILIILGAFIVLVSGLHFLSSIWTGNDFAVSFFIGCVSVILVNAVFATENSYNNKKNLGGMDEDSR